ncbi:MAG: hypothetical protein P8020_20660 [Acidobacteriota bacterium]
MNARGFCAAMGLVVLMAIAASASSYGQDSPGTEERMELIFPIVHSQFVDEPVSLQTTLTFGNLSNSTVRATITTFGDDGTQARVLDLCTLGPAGDPSLEVDLEIPSHGERDSFTTTTQEGELPDFAGWARVLLSPNVRIRGSSEIRLQTQPEGCVSAGGVSTASAGTLEDVSNPDPYLKAVRVPGVRPAREFWVLSRDGFFRRTALAIVNPSESETAQVLIEVLNQRGEVTDTTDVSVAPMNRIAKYAGELFGRPPFIHGWIRFTSPIPIAVGGIEDVQRGDPWVSIVVVPVDAPASD